MPITAKNDLLVPTSLDLDYLVVYWPYPVNTPEKCAYQVEIPASRLLQADLTLESLAWNELHNVFSPQSRGQKWLEAEKRWIRTLEYHFKGGSSILMDEVSFLKNLQTPDPAILPFYYDQSPQNLDFRDPLIDVMYDQFFDRRTLFRDQSVNQLIARVLAILRCALRVQKNQPEFKIILTDQSRRDQNRRGFLLHDMSFQKINLAILGGDLDFQFAEKAKLKLNYMPPPHTSEIYSSAGFSFLPEDGKLIFNNSFGNFKKFRDKIRWSYEEFTADLEPAPISDPFSVKVEGEDAIRAVVLDLKERQEVLGLNFKPQYKKTTIDSFTPCVSFTKEGGMSVSVKFVVDQKVIQVFNLPSVFSYILRNIENGLGGLTHLENRDLAVKRKGHTRDMDLKVLRHSGCYISFLLETINFNLGYPLSDGTVFEGTNIAQNEKEFREHLAKLLGRLLQNNSGFGNSTLPADYFHLMKWISSKVKTLLNEVNHLISSLVSAPEFPLFTPIGDVAILKLNRQWCELLRHWLIFLVGSSQGKVLQKQKDKVLTKFCEELGQNNDFLILDDQVPVSYTKKPGVSLKTVVQWSDMFDFNEVLFHHLELIEKGFEIYIDGKPMNEITSEDLDAGFSMTENAPIDWFELHPKVFFKGEEMSFEQIQSISKGGVLEFQGKFYRIPQKLLPKVKSLEKFWQRLLSQTAKGLSAKEQRVFFVPRAQTLDMLALRAKGIDFKGDSSWQKICDFYDNLGTQHQEIESLLPKSLTDILKPYQTSGVLWLEDLYRLRLGGVLADDMGLGKTVQTLAFLELHRQSGDLRNIVIVVPTSLMYNWQAETQKFTPKINLRLWRTQEKAELIEWLTGPEDKEGGGRVIVVTYSLLVEHIEFFEKCQWQMAIFDEAQNLKNLTAQRTTSARKLNAHFKLGLSGTPFENNFIEYYSLLDLVLPGSLGSLSEFTSMFGRDTIKGEDVEYLRLKTKPLVLRRTKQQVLLDLPEKTETVQKIPFSEKQKQIYRNIAISHSQQIQDLINTQGESKSQLQMLTALLRLRQACSDPAALPNVTYTEIPPKIEFLLESIQEHLENGESILIFTQFISTLERICGLLDQRKIRNLRLFGQVTQQKRRDVLYEFNHAKESVVMVMTLKTGGVGLNLTKASVVYHIEPWWNPAVENQATDRVHRLGQSREVTVYRMIMEDSLEEKIELLKSRKEAHFNMIFKCENITDPGLLNNRISKEDFDFLLKI